LDKMKNLNGPEYKSAFYLIDRGWVQEGTTTTGVFLVYTHFDYARAVSSIMM
jgi:hypothetical protein